MAKGEELAEQAIKALHLWKQVRVGASNSKIQITKQNIIQDGRQLAKPKNEFTQP